MADQISLYSCSVDCIPRNYTWFLFICRCRMSITRVHTNTSGNVNTSQNSRTMCKRHTSILTRTFFTLHTVDYCVHVYIYMSMYIQVQNGALFGNQNSCHQSWLIQIFIHHSRISQEFMKPMLQN